MLTSLNKVENFKQSHNLLRVTFRNVLSSCPSVNLHLSSTIIMYILIYLKYLYTCKCSSMQNAVILGNEYIHVLLRHTVNLKHVHQLHSISSSSYIVYGYCSLFPLLISWCSS